MTKEIKDICQSLGIKSKNDSNNKINGGTSTSILRMGTNELIKKLLKTVSNLKIDNL